MEKLILRELRESKRIKATKVAEALGITKQSYYKYERDIGLIKVNTMIKIFDIIGATKAERKLFCNEIANL